MGNAHNYVIIMCPWPYVGAGSFKLKGHSAYNAAHAAKNLAHCLFKTSSSLTEAPTQKVKLHLWCPLSQRICGVEGEGKGEPAWFQSLAHVCQMII